MAAGSDSQSAAAVGRARGGLRASHTDREQVIGTLKAAFVQGRLTGDELGERTGQVYAARTYADLAEVTADIPAGRPKNLPGRDPWRATKIAGWIEYAVILPGIFSLFGLKGPHDSETILIVLPTAVYFSFWIVGGCLRASARSEKRFVEQQQGLAAAGATAGAAGAAEGAAAGAQLPVYFFDREQVTRTLKAALEQGRLTEDEHDARVAQVPAVKSQAELAELTADLPAGLTPRPPATKDVLTGVGLVVAAVSVLAALVLLQPNKPLAFLAALGAAATILLVPGITVGLMVDVRHQRRASR